MAGSKKKSSIVGWILGIVLLAGGCFSVFMLDWEPEKEVIPEVVRPLKTLLVESPFTRGDRVFPGRVKAARQVDLAFEVSGTITELPVNKGDSVTKEQILAQLDPRDYQNDLDAAQAEAKRAQSHLDRIKEAIKTDAVSQQDLSNAEAAYETARAQMNIKQKAMDDTKLLASFDGVVADRYVENHSRVSAKQAIMSLQDISALEIEVSVPETLVAHTRRTDIKSSIVAQFDFLPGEEFELEFKEATAEADSATQTYLVTFLMKQVQEATILPGMTAKVVTAWKGSEEAEEAPHSFSLPLDILIINADETYAVWKLKEDTGGAYTVHKCDVKVGTMSVNSVEITSGVQAGDRLAAAGVHLLKEGKRVKLLVEKQQGGDAQ